MDWQAVETGLRQWVIDMGPVPSPCVSWDMEPADYGTYPQVDLRLYDHRARQGYMPEVHYPPPDAQGVVRPSVAGQRQVSWSITVTVRDQHANAKAYVLLDQLALMLELPYSQEVFASLGLSLIDGDQVIVSSYPASEHRNLSQAVLRCDFGYVLCVTAPVGTLPASDAGVIEHAEIGGTVINVDEPIDVPPEMMPPLPEVSP